MPIVITIDDTTSITATAVATATAATDVTATTDAIDATDDIKIILISMIKNEEKIIHRCIETAQPICDAFCITDTGSTDDTVKIINEYATTLKEKNTPCKVYEDTWINFGANRTIAYLNAMEYCKELGWNPEKTYGLLLDADMKLVISPEFSKQSLTRNGYKLLQGNDGLEYYNTRLVKLNGSWKCIGVTHEYWDGSDLGTLDKSVISINDIGDGGCKEDKFQRDAALLEKGIEAEPTNGRYHFYLAQTYKDLGRHKDAIKLYKKRIALGGWQEELWYSHYMIAKCWASLNNIEKAEAWGNKAYQYRKSRAEPLYLLTSIFRKRGDHYKAYHYYRLGKNIPVGTDSLFVEKNVYKYLFDYEYTILQYWVFPKERREGLRVTVDYLNKYTKYEDTVYNNMDHYMMRLGDECTSLIGMEIAHTTDNFCPSSSSIIEDKGRILVNVRYVNYRIHSDGSYTIYDGNHSSMYNCVRTQNGILYLDNNYEKLSQIEFFDNALTDVPARNTNIRGLEDIRLFTFKGKVHYVAVTKEYSYCDSIRIVMGEYDIASMRHINNVSLYPPEETSCEKNWIPINHKDEKILFVYAWSPLRIGELDAENKLQITITHETPDIFRHYRGSTPFCEYEGALWCITHGVKYYTPRKYYHQFVVLEKDTYKPLQYSLPFYFNKYEIEYTVGLLIKNKEAVVIFSQNDKDTAMLRINMETVKKYLVSV